MKDLIVVGAGPVGIYAAYIAALRGLTVTLIEASDKPGGQAINVFAKKAVYDMPGLTDITGETLINNNLKQLKQKSDLVDVFTNEGIEYLEKGKNGEVHVCTKNNCHVAKTVILATGNGIYKPRPFGIDYKEAKNVVYTVKDFKDFKNKKVLVFGGGDSALDWANMIADNGAKSVSLVHRRKEFRAKGDSITTFEKKNNTNILTPYEPVSCEVEDGLVKSVTIENEEGTKKLDADIVLVNFGAQLNKDMVRIDEKLKIEIGKILVDGWCRSTIEPIWAIGNACTREGKVNVIVSGYGEAVSAVASVATYIDPKASPTFLSSAQVK